MNVGGEKIGRGGIESKRMEAAFRMGADLKSVPIS